MPDLHALSGAYAVDALTDVERRSFERHLAECTDCRIEVAEFRETLAQVAEQSTTPAPEAMKQRVLNQIATTRPLPPQTETGTPRPKRRSLFLAAAASVAAIALGVSQPWQQEVPLTDQVIQAGDVRTGRVDLGSGASATIYLSRDLGKAVMVTKALPDPPEGEVYAAWLQQADGSMSPAGVMGGGNHKVLLKGNAAAIIGVGVTLESSTNSRAPTTKPIALIEL